MGMKKDKPDYGESRWYQFEITEDWEKHTIPVTVIFLLLLQRHVENALDVQRKENLRPPKVEKTAGGMV